ncbi:MAG: nuclear transport factor 2 family protein [Caldisericaceae bacterium]
MNTNASGEDERKNTIGDLGQFVELWTSIYNTGGKPDWSHILPYYSDNIYFEDTIQKIRGIKDFSSMVDRLTKRSKELRFRIINSLMEGNIIFMEWEMTISFRGTKSSAIRGASRIKLDETGKISEQRDYYDLWGDIYDNIPLLNRLYRAFMRKVFG